MQLSCELRSDCVLWLGDCGDEGVMIAFEEIVAPAARRFQPDIILVCHEHWHALQLWMCNAWLLFAAMPRMCSGHSAAA